ncbi:hypothetical protein [Leucobacter sp. UCMA 4100]|uniref:hypothetical protein n=1 Tax=Leucobacter sp. UCMA 4100 TaxID=2810534 RepID=UPI0022EAF103|nr:hypothetical protein [Leucobacter sp. UCMA 4100]
MSEESQQPLSKDEKAAAKAAAQEAKASARAEKKREQSEQKAARAEKRAERKAEAAKHQPADADDPEASGVPGKKAWAGPRLVALIAGVAVVSLLAGILVMQFIVSPAELAARTEAPEAGPITAPVEKRAIENTVVMRGEVTYADPVELEIDTAGLAERAVVTGHVPDEGAIFESGNIALEVAGRPVLVLPGELPAYRNLSVGLRGPDVAQLKAALAALDIWAGDQSSDVFENDTAWGVQALYERAGYDAPTGGDEARDTLRGAERAVRDANVGVSQAQADLRAAREAQEDDSVALAQLQTANESLGDAQRELGEAQIAVLPSLPSSEVVFVASLPRRVDSVYVKRGDVLQNNAMIVSGATLTISGTVAKQDAELLKKDSVGFFPGPDGDELEAKVTAITEPKAGKKNDEGGGNGGGGEQQGSQGGDSGGRYTVTFAPGELTSEQIEALRGTNVRVRVPVEATDGEVLAVPIAALSAGSGGDNRIELLTPTKKDPYATEIIEVTVGLAADGFVEVSASDKRIEPGAKIVVGR